MITQKLAHLLLKLLLPKQRDIESLRAIHRPSPIPIPIPGRILHFSTHPTRTAPRVSAHQHHQTRVLLILHREDVVAVRHHRVDFRRT
jgi:hypothetical protein